MTALRIKTAAIIYGALTGIAIVLGFVWGNPNIYCHPEGLLASYITLPTRLLVGGGIGTAFGLVVAFLTRFTVYRFDWAKNLHQEFRGLFGPISSRDIFYYAALSAVAEELFFRGALQPTIGIVAVSFIFGLLHVAPGKQFIPWTLQAFSMGFALGGLYFLTGDLTAPIAAHFTINYQNLHFINRYDPNPELPRSFQSFIGTRHAAAEAVNRHPR